MRKSYLTLAFAMLSAAIMLGSYSSRGQAVQGPPAPATQPAPTTQQQAVINALAGMIAGDNSQIAAGTQANLTLAQNLAAALAANAQLQQQVQAAAQSGTGSGFLCTNLQQSNYYTSNIYANICQQSSAFYNVGDAPAGTLNANGYPIGNNIHMRSQNWLYDVAAGTLNVSWTGTNIGMKLSVYGPGTWTQTGPNSGTLVLPSPGTSATQPANNNPTLVLWIDVTNSSPTSPLNNLCIWQPGYGPGTANAGLMFRKDFTAILSQYGGCRIMSAVLAMSSPATQPSDLVSPINYNQVDSGCAYANLTELAKEANLKRVWVCLPYQLNAAGQQQIAQMFHDALPGVTIIFEWTDEPWNVGAGFSGYPYLNTLADTTNPGKYDGTYNAAGLFVPTPAGQPYVNGPVGIPSLNRMARAAADIERTASRNIRPIFADNPGRFKMCLSSQAGNSFWASEGLKWINAVYGNTNDFDAIIEAPYFTFWPDNNTTVATGPNGTYLLSDLANGVQSDFVRYVIPQVQAHTAIAKAYGKLHYCYEAGQGFYPQTNPGPFTGLDLSTQYNYSREIGKDYLLYYLLLKTNGVNNCFDFDLGPTYWNQYGYWATLQSLGTGATDPTGPTPINWRYQAQLQAIGMMN